MDSHLSDSMNDVKQSKSQVIRGARACTVCRAAKMKCVGAEDGQRQCQRCKRANVECIFEKHRRGRKPGSKLSEASKMLRRLEKGLNSAKLKSQSDLGQTSPYMSTEPHLAQDTRYMSTHVNEQSYSTSNSHYSNTELPPLNIPAYTSMGQYAASSNGSRTMDIDDDEDDGDKNNEAFYPSKIIRQENQRNSFFNTILNPEETPVSSTTPNRSASFSPPQAVRANTYQHSQLGDPISTGIMDEKQAGVIFDAMFLRLNPFINMFDPALHSMNYVRTKCPFLFTTLLMAGCKFFKPELFKQCQKLANELAIRAFAEQWKRVEVVQAFACLTYWKDPDDNRTWAYIGYACRMAVELNLNRYYPEPPEGESRIAKLERRNRERTYLILFVHDRSLSTQTGRHWMLPEDNLVRHSSKWHEQGLSPPRPEDVILAAFVSLRRLTAQKSEDLNRHRTASQSSHSIVKDFNYESDLHCCNRELAQWDDTWRKQMEIARGEKFHFSFLRFFCLHDKLFLNSYAISASMTPGNRYSPSPQAFKTCCASAMDSLRIVSEDLASMGILGYGQDSITVMSAYSAVFLLRLFRSPVTNPHLTEENAEEIHSLISKTADAYQDAANRAPASTSAACHARFLGSLIANDIFKNRRYERQDSGVSIDPRLQGPAKAHGVVQRPISHSYPQQVSQPQETFHFPASPHLPAHPYSTTREPEYTPEIPLRNSLTNGGHIYHQSNGHQMTAPNTSDDEHYWKHMFIELGFGGDPNSVPNETRNLPQYIQNQHPQHVHSQHQQQGQIAYHHMPASQPTYGR